MATAGPRPARNGPDEPALAAVAAAAAARRPPGRLRLAGRPAHHLQLIRDVQEAGGRISKLVADVKTYSHMDRAGGFELLDVTAGLESTLNMLGFQLRQKNVRVIRDYAPDLPPIRGQVSSLNQVWTNLWTMPLMRCRRRAAKSRCAPGAKATSCAYFCRQRRRHSGRGAAAYFRAVLHHQAGRRRLRPGARHCAAHHPAARRAAGSALPARPHRVLRLAAGSRALA